jgi:hypothetical protein
MHYGRINFLGVNILLRNINYRYYDLETTFRMRTSIKKHVIASDSVAIFDMQAANFSIEDCFVPRNDARGVVG